MLKGILIGNIGSDPDMRYSANGSPLLRFNVASNGRTRTPDGEWVDETTWVRVTVLGKRAETLSQHLHKGQRVYVDGRLEARPWTDQQGAVRAGLEILAGDVEFTSARQAEDDQPVRASVTDERRDSRRMSEATAVHGGRPARSAAAVADRDDGDLEDLPF
jgi:single stranded DNA-binding protein